MKPKTPFLKYREFECRGKGLTFSSQSRATPIEIISALAERHRATVDGRVSKPSTSADAYSKTWWEAQVHLYGLKCSDWTVDGMSDVLMNAISASFKAPKEFLVVEKQLNHDFECMDWNEHEQQAVSPEDTLVATQEIKEHHSPKSGDDPPHEVTLPEDDAEEDVVEIIPKICTFEGRRGGWKSSLRRNPEKRLDKITRLHKKYLSSDDVDDTIFGEWHLDFPHIEDSPGEDIVWNIHLPDESKSCLWVVIDQIELEGIVRIPWKTPESWRSQTLSFSFRGGEIMSGYNSSGHGEITFTSSHECSGTFKSEWDEPWTFVGKKVSNKLPNQDKKHCQIAYGRSYSHRKEYWKW